SWGSTAPMVIEAVLHPRPGAVRGVPAAASAAVCPCAAGGRLPGVPGPPSVLGLGARGRLAVLLAGAGCGSQVGGAADLLLGLPGLLLGELGGADGELEGDLGGEAGAEFAGALDLAVELAAEEQDAVHDEHLHEEDDDAGERAVRRVEGAEL